MLAHFKKVNLKPYRHLKEFRIKKELDGVKAGDEIKVDVFSPGEYVDISGFTKGKGFQGVVKRHNFAGGPKTHGQSNRYRSPGAIGAQRPQRVKKGTRMAGHMGYRWKTVQKLEIVNVLPEHNLLTVRGSAPGPNNNLLVIKKTLKKVREKKTELIPGKAMGKGKAPTAKAMRKKKK
jgi:large subunit ribosomal protein L3